MKKNTVFLKEYRMNGSAMVQISNKFITDLKRIAEIDTKITEYDELGRIMNLKKERET